FSMTMVANFVVLGGQLLLPGVAYLCGDWQVLQAVIICPLLLMLSYIWIFPESLRWLLATQQYGRSKWIMGHIAKKNRVNMELDVDNILTELQRALQKKPKKTCIVKMVGTRNLWKNIVVLCVNSLTGYGIHHCFARSMMDPEALETTMFHNFYADYYTMAGIAVASCMALCPAVGLMGRRGGLLMFMIITALASLLQLGLLNHSSGTLNKNFSIAFSIIGMFSSHAVSNLSIFFCAEITPTVIRGGGLGLVLASAGFGMLTAPIMELHNQKGYFLHHIIFACCTLICIICILLLPETRYQPLPETLADGESYTRQPLLHPRKPGEQHLLLGQAETSRDYTRVGVGDTPLHVAAATAVSTMDSTASSAVDLTADVPVFMEVHQVNPELKKDPNGHSVSSLTTPIALGKDAVVHASREHLLSSTPLHKASRVTDPLLASADEPPAIVLHSLETQANSDLPEVNETSFSPSKDPETPPSSPRDPSASSPVPPSSLISTTPVIEPPPTSTLESPELAQDGEIALKSEPEPASAPSESSPVPTMHDNDPPKDSENITTTVNIPDIHLEIIDQLSPGESSLVIPQENDPTYSCVNEVTSPETLPSPLLPPPADQKSLIDSFTPPLEHPADPILPVTDIVNSSPALETTTQNGTDIVQADPDSSTTTTTTASSLDLLPPPPLTDSTQANPSYFEMDRTVSSPIDSGVLSIRDSASTESDIVAGVSPS
uniref:Solute carrier family 22 member 23 n=1 Tax=Periophthalmus magnuspinnatus TaxID=409849 RepID=A0A3B4BCZ8_9GOBI